MMKEEILDIAKKLYHNHLTPELATDLLLRLFDISGSLPTDKHFKFAEWCISNGVTTYYNEDDGERYIDNDKEIFFDISQIYEKFKRQ